MCLTMLTSLLPTIPSTLVLVIHVHRCCCHECGVGTSVLSPRVCCRHECGVATSVVLPRAWCWHECAVATSVVLPRVWCCHEQQWCKTVWTIEWTIEWTITAWTTISVTSNNTLHEPSLRPYIISTLCSLIKEVGDTTISSISSSSSTNYISVYYSPCFNTSPPSKITRSPSIREQRFVSSASDWFVLTGGQLLKHLRWLWDRRSCI